MNSGPDEIVPILNNNIPVKIAFIADGEPTTSDVEICEISSSGATLIGNERLKTGLKIGLVVMSRDEQVAQAFIDTGLVIKPFTELRTQARVLSSKPEVGERMQTRIQFTGNLRVADAGRQ